MSSHHEFDRRTILKATGAATAVGALGGVAAAAPTRPAGPKDDEVLVGVSAGHDLVETVAPVVPSEAAVVHENEGLRYVAVKFPSRAPETARRTFIEAVQKREGVKYAEANKTHEAFYTPNDPKYPAQYVPQQIDAPCAWDETLGCSGTEIVVVDTGVQYDHPNLRENACSDPGTDLVDDDSDPYPDVPQDEYHGTHVSGIASGVIDDGDGTAGIGNCPVCVCRALDENGSGSTADIADCIQWATDQGADIINLSLGGGGYTSTMKNAVQYAANNGALVVCAAGNSGSSSVAYPAAYSECMAVAAVDENENLGSFSNYGSSVDICAPGVDVLSTTTETRGSYERLSGTSMAAPVVSGVACLAICHWGLTNSEARSHLKATATDIGLSSDKQGAGQVNACDAVTTDPGIDDGGGGSGDSTSTTISDSLSGSSDYDDWTYDWTYTSPSTVEVVLDGPSDADFDLYVNTGATTPASPDDYDYASYTTDSQESIAVDSPDTSTPLRIDVDAYSGSGSYDVTVTEYE